MKHFKPLLLLAQLCLSFPVRHGCRVPLFKPRPLGNSSNYLRILVKEDNSICVIDDLGQEQNNISEQILSSPVVVKSIESVIENREEILSTEIKLDGNNDNTHIVIMSASGI